MCTLCLKDDIFGTVVDFSSVRYKRQRAIEIKRLLKDAEDDSLCHIGDVTVERLKEEQYKISRDL